MIVKFYGAANLMPWNSTKSAINFSNPAFKGLLDTLLPIVKDYSSLSRRLKGNWEEKVFKFDKGEVKHLDIQDVTGVRKSFLPPLPRVRKKRIDHLRESNASIITEKPWVVGLLDSLAAQEIIGRQRLATRNRISLIILDSAFEIALKEFVVHTEGLNRGGKTLEELFKQRSGVLKVVKQKINFNPSVLSRIDHYYLLRNKLIHERATVDITDGDIENFRAAVVECLEALFGLRI